MAGFGSISLAQTVVGTLIDQRAVVLYKQPKTSNTEPTLFNAIPDSIQHELWGNSLKYEELFAGLSDKIGSEALRKVINVTGSSPYGITYISAKVNIESDLCDHPIETGEVLTDASIIQPVVAQVEVAMPTFFAERIYNSMLALQQKKNDKIILQTKYGVYKNLVLQNFTYSLENKTVDRTVFVLTLREVKEVAAYGKFKITASSVENVANASDIDTVSNGTQVAEG